MTVKTIPFDPAELLDTPEAIAAFLQDAFESADAGHIAEALGIVARAHGMSALATSAGLNRQALYRSLAPDSRTEFGTVLKVLGALDLDLQVRPRVHLDELG